MNDDRYLVALSIDDVQDVEALDLAFDKSKADERKLWLGDM